MCIIVTFKNYYARCTFCGISDESEETYVCHWMLEHVQHNWLCSKYIEKPAQTKVHDSKRLLEAVVWRLLARIGFSSCFSVPLLNPEILIQYRNWLHPHLQEVPLGYNKRRYPTSLKTFILSIFKLVCFEIIQLLVEVTNRYYHQYWTHWTKDGPHCLVWLFRKYVCFWQLLCGLGTIRGACWEITGQH